MEKVVVTKADTYDDPLVASAMKELLDELGGIPEFIKPKPNMLEGVDKGTGVTTHP